MTVQEFAVHILLARAKRIEHFSWVLETQAQPLYQARIILATVFYVRLDLNQRSSNLTFDVIPLYHLRYIIAVSD